MNRVAMGRLTPVASIGFSFARLKIISLFLWLLVLLLSARLVFLMIFRHEAAVGLVASSSTAAASLSPTRGLIFFKDYKTGEEVPAALNRDSFILFADTRLIKNKDEAEKVAIKLAEILGLDDEEKFRIFLLLQKPDDPYEPIRQKMTEEEVELVRAASLPGIGFERVPERFYPEGNLAAGILGFTAKGDKGELLGRYGLEGYWQDELSGESGYEEGLRSASGRLVPSLDNLGKPVRDGDELVLTIDRFVQYQVCERLRKSFVDYEAKSAALVVLSAKTGAVIAMCSLPDFDPNFYNRVEDVAYFNNTSIFTPYEPGSVMKPIVMAAALNEGVIKPETKFVDTGERARVCDKPIMNAGFKSYGEQTMVGVLEYSINTGMVFIAERLGKTRLREYLEKFGFGVKSGIELSTEAAGTIESLSRNEKRNFDCYTATASFGQGVTATLLQTAAAYAVIANDGRYLPPFVVAERRTVDGRREAGGESRSIKSVIGFEAARFTKAMLASVVKNGQGKGAQIPGYTVAGKTGTAQIAVAGGYKENAYNHSFAGFAPVDEPEFVVAVRFEEPNLPYSADTAAPVFRDVMKILLKYADIPPEN